MSANDDRETPSSELWAAILAAGFDPDAMSPAHLAELEADLARRIAAARASIDG